MNILGSMQALSSGEKLQYGFLCLLPIIVKIKDIPCALCEGGSLGGYPAVQVPIGAFPILCFPWTAFPPEGVTVVTAAYLIPIHFLLESYSINLLFVPLLKDKVSL